MARSDASGDATSGPMLRLTIPRISHDQGQMTASSGIWLHTSKLSPGWHGISVLEFLLVAGVGFEPT